MYDTTPSISLQAIDKLCKKARALLSTHPLEAQRLASDAQQRLLSRPLKSLAERRKLAYALLILARCALSAQDPHLASERAKEALEVVQDIPATRERAEAFNVLGLALRGIEGQPAQAMEMFYQSLALLQDGAHQQLRCKVLYNVGLFHGQLGEHEKALSCIEESLAIATAIGDHESVYRALVNIGNVHGSRSNTALALEYFMRALTSIEQHAPEKHQVKAQSLVGIGSALQAMGNYDQALEYHLRGLQVLENAGLHRETENVLLPITLIYMHNGAYHEALEYLYKGLAISVQRRKSNESYTYYLGFFLQNIAETLLNLQQYEEALQRAQECYHICENNGNRLVASYALFAIGKALLGLGQAEEGLLRLQEGFVVCQELQYDKGIISAGAAIGLALGKAGQPEQGIVHALSALALAEKTGQKPLLWDAHKVLTELYEMMGDDKLALQHHKAMYEINTQLFNENSAQRLQALQVLHKVEEAKKEAELYKVQTAHLQQQMEEQKRMIAAKAMYLSQHSELLLYVKKALASVAAIAEGEMQQKVQDIMSTLQSALNDNQSWSSFEDQFQHLQHAFVEELQKLYPQMSMVELRVCSLLKMNLSSKEICRILTIAPRSVDVYRYRIRKKLQLPPEESLSAFLAGVKQTAAS